MDNGHVIADAVVSGLQDYFVRQRVRVWLFAGARQSIMVPAHLIVVWLREADGPVSPARSD